MGNPDRFFPRGDDRFRVEVLDDDVLLLDVQTNVVHRVPGAEVDRLLAGSLTYATGHLPPGGARAIRRAVDEGSLARRSLLVGGGALVASGILATGLPFAAAAASLFPSPFDGATYTDGWNGQTDASWNLFGEWDSVRFSGPASATFPGPQDYEEDFVTLRTVSAQVVLHATSGTRHQGDGNVLGAGHGAYIVATISNIATGGPSFWFSIRAGGRGGGNENGDERGGNGGLAVGAFLWDGGGTPDWMVVAGAGGGDGGGDLERNTAGGAAGRAGSGSAPGQGASGATGGAAGADASGAIAGYAADPTNDEIGRDTPPLHGGGGSTRGGGGGAGWAGGGGGGVDSGGGGGSSFLKTSGSGAVVSAYSIYTVPRAYSSDGSTVRVELYTP